MSSNIKNESRDLGNLKIQGTSFQIYLLEFNKKVLIKLIVWQKLRKSSDFRELKINRLNRDDPQTSLKSNPANVVGNNIRKKFVCVKKGLRLLNFQNKVLKKIIKWLHP